MMRLLSFSRWKLQWKFLLIFVLLIILPMLVFSLFIYSQANQAVQLQAISNTKGHVEKIDRNLTAVMQDIEDISSYMIYSDDIRTFLKTSDIPENRTRINEIQKRINGFATFHLTSKFYLHSISIVSNNGSRLDIGTTNSNLNEEIWTENAVELKGKPYWSDTYKIQGNDHILISLNRVINDINNVSQSLGLVTIRLDTNKLYEIIDSDFQNLEKVVVLNRNGNVVLHPETKYSGFPFPDRKVVKAVRDNRSSFTTLSYKEKNENYNVIIKSVEGTDLVILGIVNEDSVAEGISGMRGSIRSMMIVLTLFGLIALIGFYHFNIRRIMELADQTKQLEKGDFSANVTVHSNDEIGLLGIRFNKMVERLRYLIENEYKMELRNRESELKLLQSQINPHFLYNTLDMIRWTARLENALETSKLIEQLSKMFRISLNRGKPWITLKDELIYSQSYLELQKRRLGDKLLFSILCDHDALKAIVLKQTIQPIIENSLNHGFENMRSLRKIYIRCYRKDHELILDVMDNGKGFSSDNLQSLLKKGYALQNIQERLKIAFEEDASISIKQNETPGAWVRITMPYTERADGMEVVKNAGELDETQSIDS
ncbi:MAG: sensor histidine kinase [Bacillota bacterium]